MAQYTLILGTRNWSSWSLRPYVALMATGQPFEEVTIKLRVQQHPTTRDTILAHSPSGKVPVLKIAEGGRTHTVWDSLAICETIAERHPDAGLWPDDAFARATARAYAAEMHAGFPNLRDQLTMEFARRLPLPDLRPETRDEIIRIATAWEAALAAHPGGFLFGRFCVADAMYAPVVSRFVTYGVAVPPQVSAYMARMMALPAMIQWGRLAQAEVDAGLEG